MKYLSKGWICIFLLTINIFIGVPILLTTYHSTHYYEVRTYVVNKEGIDCLKVSEEQGYDYSQLLKTKFRSSLWQTDDMLLEDMASFKRVSGSSEPIGEDWIDVFKLEKTPTGLPVISSTSNSRLLAEDYNRHVLATIAATPEVEVASTYREVMTFAYVMMKVFAGFFWLVTVPTFVYFLYVALWPSKDKKPTDYR